MTDEEMDKLRELNRSLQTETIAPPSWWITFTPYGFIEFEFNGNARELFTQNARAAYKRESMIFLEEWENKYALIQVIKELMER
jgi:hypothetical protein